MIKVRMRCVMNGPDCQFVEMENKTGKSINLGEWVKGTGEDAGYWFLEFLASPLSRKAGESKLPPEKQA